MPVLPCVRWRGQVLEEMKVVTKTHQPAVMRRAPRLRAQVVDDTVVAVRVGPQSGTNLLVEKAGASKTCLHTQPTRVPSRLSYTSHR